MKEKDLKNLPFPDEGPQDGDVFFHREIVCYYHADKKTWECRRNLEYRQ